MSVDTASLVESLARELHDPDKARWTAADWADYVNGALDKLAEVRPEAFATIYSVVLKEGPTHHVPEDGFRFLSLTNNIDRDGYPGDAIERVDERILSRFDPGWRAAEPADTVEHYLWDERDPTVFNTVPPVKEGTRVQLMYAKRAPTATDTSLPTIEHMDQAYTVPLRHWMLYRARSKETSSLAKQEAQMHYQWFYQALGGKVPAEKRVDPRTQEDS